MDKLLQDKAYLDDNKVVCGNCKRIKWIKLLITPYQVEVPRCYWMCVTCGNIVQNSKIPVGAKPYNMHDIICITINGRNTWITQVNNPLNKTTINTSKLLTREI